VFTKKKRQIGEGELVLIALETLALMLRNLVPTAALVIVAIAVFGFYLIWKKL
jgi:hypothetical protein